MGKRSTKENKNIYQTSRESLALTREKASEQMLYISADRIEKIENASHAQGHERRQKTIAVPLSFITRWRPDDGGQPEGICIPRAPGRTFCSSLQDRLQPVTVSLWPKVRAYSSRSTRYLITGYFSRQRRACQVRCLARG